MVTTRKLRAGPDCPVCAHARAHGWWGQSGAHCRDCHRSWTSTTQVHCVVCHEQFASDGVARLHWTKAGHVHPSTVARLAGHDERHGLVWRRADSQKWERASSEHQSSVSQQNTNVAPVLPLALKRRRRERANI